MELTENQQRQIDVGNLNRLPMWFRYLSDNTAYLWIEPGSQSINLGEPALNDMGLYASEAIRNLGIKLGDCETGTMITLKRNGFLHAISISGDENLRKLADAGVNFPGGEFYSSRGKSAVERLIAQGGDKALTL